MDTLPQSRVTRVGLWIAGAIAFALLATLNAAGYRYGASDQAFYIPAVLLELDPGLFPRDAALIVSQGRLSVFEELVATLVRLTGVPLTAWFLLGYAAALLLLYTALVRLGRHFFRSPWSIAALVFACTLRHRITKTGVNTLEGYFQPRLLVFALGLLAVDATLRKRPLMAGALLIAGGVLHTTTALWFAVWVGVMIAVEEARWRKAIVGVGLLGAAAAAALFATGTLSLAPMDAEWMRAFADKDYIFPTDWNAGTWLLNLLLPAIVLGVFLWRRRTGQLRPGEIGLVCGCLALIAIFLVTLPLVAARSAFITQLQVSRLFWMSDLLATIYVVWLATEAGAALRRRVSDGVPDDAPGLRVVHADVRRLGAASFAVPRRAAAIALLLGLVALGRGWYVLTVEHPGRPLVEAGFPEDAWTDASRWLRTHTPKDAQILADPGHAWRYGLSLRVSAERDVLLEQVKDSAIALYGRPVAARVLERSAALGDFDALTADRARALASRYDLDYLVIDRPLPLPEVYRNARFHVYRLDAGQLAGPAARTPQQNATMFDDYRPSVRWGGGHRMTVYAWGRKRAFPRLPAPEARYFDVAPDARVLAHCYWQPQRDRHHTLLALHGLEGSSSAHYMRGLADKALAAGFNAVLLNQRNCGGTESLSAGLYHSGLTHDPVFVMRALIASEGLPSIGVVGYSLGGNLTLKLAGDFGHEAPPELTAVCAVSPTMDLALCVHALERRSNFIYQWNFVRNLKGRMRRKAALAPGRWDLGPLARVRSVRAFDEAYTAPHHGFRDADDYYFRASALRVVDRIAVPALILASDNDPFVPHEQFTRPEVAGNPRVTVRITRDGGHCAFVSEKNAADANDDGYWAERSAIAFHAAHAFKTTATDRSAALAAERTAERSPAPLETATR